MYSRLEVGQNSNGVKLLAGIQKYFNQVFLKPQYDITKLEAAKKSRRVSRYIITNNFVVISFIDKYTMFTQKHLYWKKLIQLKNKGAHKTIEGKFEMFKLKSRMNSNRSSLNVNPSNLSKLENVNFFFYKNKLS